jgi:hypothetical protein
MKRTTDEVALGGLLGGYGSESDEEQEEFLNGVPSETAALVDLGGGGGGLVHLISGGDGNDDGAAQEDDAEGAPMAGPARPGAAQLRMMLAASDAYPPQHLAAQDDVGPARPTAGDLQMAYASAGPHGGGSGGGGDDGDGGGGGGGADVGPFRPGAAEMAMAYPEMMQRGGAIHVECRQLTP